MFCDVIKCEIKKPCMLNACPCNVKDQPLNCLLLASQSKEFTLDDLQKILDYDVKKTYNSAIAKCAITTLKHNLSDCERYEYPKDSCVETGLTTGPFKTLPNGYLLSQSAKMHPNVWAFVILMNIKMEAFVDFMNKNVKDFSTLESALKITNLRLYLYTYTKGTEQ